MEGDNRARRRSACRVCRHCCIGARQPCVSRVASTHLLYIHSVKKVKGQEADILTWRLWPFYSEPVWPKIPGIETFKGHKTHSGRWVQDFDYSNKRIAVIGNGSSGIQIVPQMTKLPGTTVRNFIRGPAWVFYRVPASKHLGRDTDDTNPAYYEHEKEKYRDPVQHREYRKGIIHRTNKAFRLVRHQLKHPSSRVAS